MKHGSLKTYTIGFALSIALTLAAYFAVVNQLLTGQNLIIAIITLAIVQLIVQLFFFLHLGSESKPRWNLTVFVFMLIVLVILVFGSLWIMHNLDHNMMSPGATDSAIMQEEGIHK